MTNASTAIERDLQILPRLGEPVLVRAQDGNLYEIKRLQEENNPQPIPTEGTIDQWVADPTVPPSLIPFWLEPAKIQ